MKTNKIRPILSLLLINGALILTACNENQPAVNTTVSQTVNTSAPNTSVNTNSAPLANTQTAVNTQPEQALPEMPVTLPALEAMLEDESFTADLKNKVGLGDDQINKLKELSQQSIENIKQNNNADKSSTTVAAKDASDKIRAAIGDDKTTQLFKLIQDKSSGGAANLVATQAPNTVPTDTRVVVNAPAYRMDIFKDGKVYKTYKIGIGYPEFPLAYGLRKAETIIFNPTWTPPDEPWVKGKIKPGQKIEAGSSMNPLGPIKIPIGSPSLIHGGKSPAKIGIFNSHGCVGLTNAQVQDFALNLAQASGTQLTFGDIKNYQKTKDKTQNLKLAQTMPVELRYETIVVENGTLHIYRDVYERKTNSLANLKKVLQVYGVSYDSLSDVEKKKILDGLKTMNLDGSGQPIIKDVETAVAQNTNKKPDKNESGSITRTIKGGKEVAVPLPALAGKGYPSPVNLNSGNQ